MSKPYLNAAPIISYWFAHDSMPPPAQHTVAIMFAKYNNGPFKGV